VPPLHHDVHPGSGPYLLLVHGMLASRAQWLENLQALSKVATPIVTELLGHGRSPSPEDPDAYTPDRYVEEFERLRARLGAERWIVCGQSLGAALTLRYALVHPERVIAQVFTNSNSALAEAGWSEAVRPVMEALARRLEAEGRAALEAMPIHPARSRRMPPEVKRALVEDARLHDPRGVALTGLYTVPGSSVRERVAQNRVPALLVCGAEEERFAPHREFAERTMPRLEVVAARAGHAVNAEAPRVFNDAVAEFLRRARAG
jgi:pimeloyl-ACP methyl ester carboxylesterase